MLLFIFKSSEITTSGGTPSGYEPVERLTDTCGFESHPPHAHWWNWYHALVEIEEYYSIDNRQRHELSRGSWGNREPHVDIRVGGNIHALRKSRARRVSLHWESHAAQNREAKHWKQAGEWGSNPQLDTGEKMWILYRPPQPMLLGRTLI